MRIVLFIYLCGLLLTALFVVLSIAILLRWKKTTLRTVCWPGLAFATILWPLIWIDFALDQFRKHRKSIGC